MKNIAAVLYLMLIISCTSKEKHNRIVFDVSSNTKFKVIGSHEIYNDVVWIKDTSDINSPPIFQLNGQWDFSKSNQVKLVLINGNKRESLNATFIMAESDSLAEKKSLLAKKTLKAGEVTEWIISIPPTPTDIEISNGLTGMRANPFYMDGVVSTINPKSTKSVKISFDKSLREAKLGIKEIAMLKGEPSPSPSWFKMTKQEFFPFIDKYGQFIHKDWTGKTKNDDDLIADRENELAEMKNNPASADRSVYGGSLYGKRQKATGNFYVSKIDGKWWMVDPQGYLFWSHGVVRVTPSSAVTIVDGRQDYFAALPDTSSSFGEFYKTRDEFLYQYYKSWGIKQTFDFSAANLKIKYGDDWRNSYKQMIAKRLRSWGMNTISAGSDKDIYGTINVPYCDRIEIKTPKIDGAPSNLNVMRDPFHPDFNKQLTQQLLARGEELKSKWNYGYFIDNKLVWGADNDLGRWTLKSSEIQPAKKIFIEKLERKYGTIEALNTAWASDYRSWKQLLFAKKEPTKKAMKDCSEFSSVLINEYFKNVSSVMKQTAPDKLYLGCRYVVVNEFVLRIAAKYSDVLTFDLFWDSLSDFSLPNGIDKPVLIGEFHFGALDRGLFNPGLNQKVSQEERGLAYENYVTSALKNPYIIGTSWHQFSDQATTGRFDGENFQDGLTDVCDKVYSETVNKVRKIGHKLYQIRSN